MEIKFGITIENPNDVLSYLNYKAIKIVDYDEGIVKFSIDGNAEKFYKNVSTYVFSSNSNVQGYYNITLKVEK